MHIGFSTSTHIPSTIIRLFTHSPTSHAYIVFEAAHQSLVLQADHRGVICDHYTNFKQHNTIIAEYQLLTGHQEDDAILSFALHQLTKPYDFLGLVGFGWVLFNKALGIKTKQPFPRRSSYYCSELIIAALQSAHFPTSHMLDRFLTSPEELLEFLNNHLMTKRII